MMEQILTIPNYVDFDVTCDMGELNKDKVCFNEEFTLRINDTGNARVDIYCNDIVYETCFNGPYMIPQSDDSIILYAGQGLSKDKLIKTANGNYDKINIICNDSSLISLNGTYDILVKTAEGTVNLTFSYDGSYQDYSCCESFNLTVKVLKVPLTINVTNIKASEITMNVTDEMNFEIAFKLDEIHRGYAQAGDTLGVVFDSEIISFSQDNDIRLANGSYYTTAHILAKAGGTAYMTVYCDSDKFKAENYTIKITVNKIPTDINIYGGESFKVDDTPNIGAEFYVNGTLNTQTQLIYESSEVSIVNFTSNTGDFKATGNGTAILTVRFAGNSTHENSSKTVTVTVSKYETVIAVKGDKEISLKIDDKSQIKTALTSTDPSFEGVLNYTISNESVATVDKDGLVTAVGKGTATITVRYQGDRKHENSQDTLTVQVSKIETQITAEDKILNSTDENIEIEAYVDVGEGFHLDYSSSDESVVRVSADGKLTAVSGGHAQITITYGETEKYLSSTKTIKVTVKKIETEIIVKNPILTRYGETITIDSTVFTVNGTEVDEGNVSFFIGDDLINRSFIVDCIGKFNVTVKYAENSKYLASELNVTVISDKGNNIIVVSVDDAVYPNKVTVKVTAGQDDDYTVDINGTMVNIEVINGEGQNTVELPAGSYYANITGYSSPLFNGVTANDTFTVDKADSSIDIVVLNRIIHVYESISVTSIVPDDAEGNVTFRLIDNRTVAVEEVAVFDGLAKGTYIIYAVYNGDNNYKVSKEVNIINTVKYNVDLNMTVDKSDYGEDLVVKLSTNANFTGEVLVNIGRLNQTAHIAEGVGRATFANLMAGKYFITACVSEGDDFYADCANATVTVNGVEVLASQAFHTYCSSKTKSHTFSIKLDRDATGNFTVSVDNGKIVKTVALKDGAANITFDNLEEGGHQITISYSGDGKFAPITQNTTVTVDEPVKPKPNVAKKSTHITAKKKTFKTKTKVKKYTVTLKSAKTPLRNVKVTLKVKCKTYGATTNRKGEVTFKIKNLKKKGKYSAVIRFAGNNAYKPTSKKVKITVKSK